ncbi:hypothetical protein [Acidocella sp.]|uniref:hypothetical protein n=1 Tax=Acidocella sp. TaxID=50710 RepID=UPI00262C33C1|nr:hypothetical protein [Acidocella sp.]
MPDTLSSYHVPPALSAPRRPRLAIVSTYDELCGIAGYTRALEKQLAPFVDVTIFDLDQYLLRGRHRRIQKLADAHIKDIAAQLHGFDCVNIQLEHGTLGRTVAQITRRFARLAKAAPALSVTFHTILLNEDMPWDTVGRLLARGHVSGAGRVLSEATRAGRLSRGIQGLLRSLQAHKPVSVIVHTRRDQRMMQDLFALRSVHHHPLSFISPEAARGLRARTGRAVPAPFSGLPANVKFIGTFGFLSAYKGFDTAIRALEFLPPDYHLLIFGGLHPQGIRREEPLDPYIRKLLSTAHIGQSPLEVLKESGLRLAPSGAELTALLNDHPNTLHERVHFMGALSDDDFFAATAQCDVAVFPYLEVGQASSGPISIALEMGTRVIASRTAAFRAFARYHPDLIEFFDIGNFAELATRIQSPGRAAAVPDLRYNTATNAAIYLEANFLSVQKRELVACAAQ